MNRKKEIRQSSRILLSLALVLLILVTVGVSYAIYDYTSLIPTENMVTMGTITFMYDNNKNPDGKIIIQDNLPMADEEGKMLTQTSNVFDFKILGNVDDNYVPYEITVRNRTNSNDMSNMIKLYLVELDGENEKAITFDKNKSKFIKYGDLDQTTIDVGNNIIEKTIYQGTVPANSNNYEKYFRLRMWIADDVDSSLALDEVTNSFTFMINVYSKAAVVNKSL